MRFAFDPALAQALADATPGPEHPRLHGHSVRQLTDDMGTGLVLYADVAADSSNAGFAMCASPHRPLAAPTAQPQRYTRAGLSVA